MQKGPTTYSRTGNRINVAVEELTRPSYSGYLLKQGNRVQSWKKRWCVLQDFCLYYFKTPKVNLFVFSLPNFLCPNAQTKGEKKIFFLPLLKLKDLTALGMITLPSYKITTSNRKWTFQVKITTRALRRSILNRLII